MKVDQKMIIQSNRNDPKSLIMVLFCFTLIQACSFETIEAPKDHLSSLVLQSYEPHSLNLVDIQVIYFPDSISPERVSIVNQLGFLLDEFIVDEVITADEFLTQAKPLLQAARILDAEFETESNSFNLADQALDEEEDALDLESQQENLILRGVRDTITLVEKWTDLRADNRKISETLALAQNMDGSYVASFEGWQGYPLHVPQDLQSSQVTYQKTGGVLEISLEDEGDLYLIHVSRQPYRSTRLSKYPVFLIGRIDYTGSDGTKKQGFIRMKGFHTEKSAE